MNDLLQSLKTEFQDEDYRYAYAQSFLNTKLASQIKTLREQRGMTQARVAAEMKIKQPGYRRFEDVNHDVWKTDSLWNIARALDVRLDISFKTFGTLLEEKARLNKESLQLPTFEDDPAFKEPSEAEQETAAVASDDLSWLSNTMDAATDIGAHTAGLQQKYARALAASTGNLLDIDAANRYIATFGEGLKELQETATVGGGLLPENALKELMNPSPPPPAKATQTEPATENQQTLGGGRAESPNETELNRRGSLRRKCKRKGHHRGVSRTLKVKRYA